MSITYFPNFVQGSDEWRDARCGLITASEMKLLVTPTLKKASNDKERAHLWELLSQRITRFVEPSYVNDDMLRGWADEIEARALYAERYAAVNEVGFITNDKWGFTLGYSPDGLVGDNGLIECKSRRQKYQVQTLVEHVRRATVPDDYIMQIQTGLLVSEREWCDFVSYCGGLHMAVIRMWPDDKIQAAILEAAAEFEVKLAAKLDEYLSIVELAPGARLVPTERRVEQEIVV
jgi:hypothetical protein